MNEMKIYIEAMSCASCASHIGKALDGLAVTDYDINFPKREVIVEFDGTKVTKAEILHCLKKQGYAGIEIDE